MLVYPAAGLRVRDPATGRHVPDEGLEVLETDLIWSRLLQDKDVVRERPLGLPAIPEQAAPPLEAPVEEHE